MGEATPARSAVDFNNIVLSDEVMDGFDPKVNQFAAPAPVKPGLYHVSLFFAEEDTTRRWFPLNYNLANYPTRVNADGTAKTYAKTQLIGKISQPGGEFDGRKVRDTFCSTGIFGSRPTSKVASLIHLFGRGEELYAGMSDKQLRELFETCIAGEPQVRVTTDWEWKGSKEGGYQIVRGQKNFPQDSEGNYVIQMNDPTTGNSIPGFATITNYLAL